MDCFLLCDDVFYRSILLHYFYVLEWTQNILVLVIEEHFNYKFSVHFFVYFQQLFTWLIHKLRFTGTGRSVQWWRRENKLQCPTSNSIYLLSSLPSSFQTEEGTINQLSKKKTVFFFNLFSSVYSMEHTLINTIKWTCAFFFLVRNWVNVFWNWGLHVLHFRSSNNFICGLKSFNVIKLWTKPKK